MRKYTLKWMVANNFFRFPYHEYNEIEVSGTKCLIHKFLYWDGLQNLYQYSRCPSGKIIVCGMDNYCKIMKTSKYVPISIQSIAPDAPLTSSLMRSLIDGA